MLWLFPCPVRKFAVILGSIFYSMRHRPGMSRRLFGMNWRCAARAGTKAVVLYYRIVIGYIPHMQLCVCCYAMGDPKKARRRNKQPDKFIPMTPLIYQTAAFLIRSLQEPHKKVPLPFRGTFFFCLYHRFALFHLFQKGQSFSVLFPARQGSFRSGFFFRPTRFVTVMPQISHFHRPGNGIDRQLPHIFLIRDLFFMC